MARGLRQDCGTILRIPTMRYALVGVSTVGFVVTAVATWMPNFYQNQLHLSQQASNGTFGALAILGGIPGTLIGGRIADTLGQPIPRGPGGDPGHLHHAERGALHGLVHSAAVRRGVRDSAARVPGRHRLRAGAAGGLSDAAPAHVRGAGFGAFNLASVVFGSAAAPIVTSAIASQFGNNYRTAFLLILPIAFLGAACLMLARRHIEDDAAKVFEAVVLALAAQQDQELARAQERGGGAERRRTGATRSPRGVRPCPSRRRRPGCRPPRPR